MTKLSRFLALLAVVAVPVALLIAPSAASAKKTERAKRYKVNLEGPIDHPKDPGFAPGSDLCCFPSYEPTIQIKAKHKRKNRSEVVVTQYGLWGPCSGYSSSDGESKHQFTGKLKKNGKFSGTSTQYSGTAILTVSGKIVGGTASGTVREVEKYPFNEGSGTAWGTCDSGTASWTASKVKELSDVKGTFDPTLGRPGW